MRSLVFSEAIEGSAVEMCIVLDESKKLKASEAA
jgi:hypothetical protein